MELRYSILWFENEERLVKPLKKRIGKYLGELAGFLLDLTHEKNSERLDECFKKDYDLIMVDWNLDPTKSGKDISGEELIRKIRRKQIFTEIIFYSGLDDFAAQKFKLDGVYFTDTDEDNLFLE